MPGHNYIFKSEQNNFCMTLLYNMLIVIVNCIVNLNQLLFIQINTLKHESTFKLTNKLIHNTILMLVNRKLGLELK